MNPNKELWEKGDFTKIAETMRDSGASVVDSLGIEPGLKVLDLGCGDGTTALPAAQRGAAVIGVDIASNLVAAGNARAKAAGVDSLTFQEGDACDLSGLTSRSFDLVVTIFGAMFAPRPYDVAKEMVRVTKPGGRIVMGNWIPGDATLVAQILRIAAAYTPAPPAGFVSPMLWGVEAEVAERFTAAGVDRQDIDCRRDSFTFNLARPPSQLLDLFLSYYGPTMNALAAASALGRDNELRRELEALFASQNESGDTERTEIAATFLRVVVTVR